MEKETIRTLRIFTSVGAVLYLFFIAMAIFYDSYPLFKPFGSLELFLILFVVGFVLTWTKKRFAAGVIFMIWNAGIWLDDLYFNRPDADYSMMSAIASYFMFIGAFFLLTWYKTSKESVPSEQKQWRFTLRVLLTNYLVLYSIVIISELTVGESVDYFSFPLIIYPVLYLIFLIGFLLSWKNELIAGYIFLLFFVLLIASNVAYSEISTLGGWALFGLPILLQGIFYIKNHYKFRHSMNS